MARLRLRVPYVPNRVTVRSCPYLRTTGPAYNDAGGFRAHAAVLGFWVMVERKTFGTRQSLAVWHCGHWRGAGRPAGAVTSTERAKRSEV